MLNAVGNCNTIVSVYLNISKHRKGTAKIWHKRLKKYIIHLYRVLAINGACRSGITLGECVSEW